MKTWVSLVTAFLLLITGLVAVVSAEVVGRFTQVEGQVDLLKGGQLPANPVKLEDQVSLGDVVRTKSLSKANITFVDNTVITVSPESRIAVEEYMFDPSKGKRSAVLQLFQGMALAVVSKIFKTEQPDFVIKTHTAIMGVRGTEVGVRLTPNESTFLNFTGLTRVASIFPEISGDLFRKAAKVAYSFGKGYVDLGDMQATTVARGLTPTLPYSITKQDRELFLRQMVVSLSGGGGKGSAVCSATTNTCSPTSASTSSDAASNTLSTNGISSTPNGQVVVVQPVKVVDTPPPSLASLAFSQLWSGPGAMTVVNQPTTTTTFYNTGPGSGTFSITGFDPGSANISLFGNGFTVTNLAFTATITTPSTLWNSRWTGTFNSSATGSLSGPVTGTLTGTMNMTLTIPGAQTFSLQGPVTYNAGTLVFNFNYVPPPAGVRATTNVFATNGGDPRGTVTSGTWTQVAKR